VRALVAEFITTAMFVWIGCGTAVSSQAIVGFDAEATNDNSFLTAVALYMTAQCLGAILGAAVLWGSTASNTLMELTDGYPPFLLGVNTVHPDLPVASAFLGECVGTFLLVWTVMMTAVSHKSTAGNIAPIAIGWSVLLAHLVLIPLTGCGINPARSLGPMLVVIMAGAKVGYEGWWIFYTAPFVGSAAATFITVFVFGVYGDTKPDSADSSLVADEVASKNTKFVESEASKAAGEVEETETTGYETPVHA
jgi:aquaporin PIP